MTARDCPTWCTYDHGHDANLPGSIVNHCGTVATADAEDDPIELQQMRTDLPTGDTITGYLLVGTEPGTGSLDLPSDPDALDRLAAIIASAAAAIRRGQ